MALGQSHRRPIIRGSKMTTQTLGVQFQYTHTIGRQEFVGPGFRHPVAMARGHGDLVYVVNRSDDSRPEGKRVTVCTVAEDFVGEFGAGLIASKEGDTSVPDGSLIWPTSIALDKEWNVYLADEWLNRISIFTSNGDWIGKWGASGNEDGELNRPSGIAFGPDDNIYVADSLNNRIQKFTKDGGFLSKWGRLGNGDGEFNMPWGIDVDGNGHVYVADWRNDRIQKFSSDGGFLMKFGNSGAGDGEFNRPTGVGVDKDGIIYVADRGNNRLQVFAADSGFITKLGGDGTISKWGKAKLDANPAMWEEREIAHGLERERQFWGPVAVEVDDGGRIFVVESPRHRVQVYRKQAPIFLSDHL